MVRLTTILPIKMDTSIYTALAFLLPATLTCLLSPISSFLRSPTSFYSFRKRLATRSPHLLRHITHIVCLSAEEKMRWVKARWIVATVHYYHSVRYIAYKLYKCYSVSIMTPTFIRHASIPAHCSRTSVHPAITRLVEASEQSANSIVIFPLYYTQHKYSIAEISDAA